MLYFIAAEVVKQSKSESRLYALLFGRRDLVNNCEKGHFLFLQGFLNLPGGILLVLYHRIQYFSDSCHFILVMDIKAHKTHDLGWQRT